jgi:hypothetical protein
MVLKGSGMAENNQDINHRKLMLFRKLKELADRQVALLAQDKVDIFMILLSQRSRLQQMIDKLNQPAENKQQRAGNTRFEGNLEPISSDLIPLVTSIQETDKKIEAMILERRNKLMGDIKDLREGKKVVRGYGGKSGFPPRYVDQHK